MLRPLAPLLALPFAAVLPLQAQAPAQSLDTLRVSVDSRAGTAAAAPFRTVDVLTRADIDRLPALSVLDVLARALGADVPLRSPASGDLSLRGSSFEQVLVLVDGVRVSDDQSGHFDLDLAVPLATIERVEVLRGAGSALYGPDAVGGVVNIVTRRGAAADGGARVQAAARGGSFGTALLGLAGQATRGGLGLQAGADYQRSDGHRAGTDYEIVQARAGATQSGALGTLAVDLGLGLRSFGANAFYGPFTSHERTTTATGAVRWTAPARVAGWQVAAAANARRHGDRYTLERANPARYQNRHTGWQTGAELVARRLAGPLALAVGAEGWDARLESARLGDRRLQRVAGFAEASAAGARLGGSAGLRADWSSEFGTVVTPSLAARVHATDALALRASATGGHRNPTWTERYYVDPVNVGDPLVQPERFWAGELGARLAAGDNVTLDAAAWLRRADRLIDWARPTGAATSEPWRTRNVEDATFTGVELRADVARWAGARWTLRAATLDVDAAAAAGYTGKYALRPLSRQVALTTTAPLGRGLTLATDVGWLGYAGERAQARADVRLAYDVRRARLTLDATNLTGADYLDAAGQPVAGRGVYVGVEWR